MPKRIMIELSQLEIVLNHPAGIDVSRIEFDVMDASDPDFAVVALRETDTSRDICRAMTEILGSERNISLFVESFHVMGYRFSTKDEFEKWHEKYRSSYMKMAKLPKLESINGGLDEKAGIGARSPMLVADYAPKEGKVATPDPTDLGAELFVIFPDRPEKKAAILLKRLQKPL